MTDLPQTTETSAPTGSSEAIVARVDGTRPCLRCGHDLHGQSIVREPEYGLFIARCSECGTVAAMTCEVNIRPENPISMRMHLGLGFREVGQQETGGGEKRVAMLRKAL